MDEKKVFAPVEIPDYRIMRPTAYLQNNGNIAALVQQQSRFFINGHQISFPTPNAITLFYNKSWKEYEQAKNIYDELVRKQTTQKTDVLIEPEIISRLYDYFEHIQTSIISIYSAIEALANVAIPENFTLTKKNSKGITEVWDKVAIERWTATEEKIGKIVPEILKIESPKKLLQWESFKKLKKIRDNIIHQKQSVNKSNEVESSFLQIILDKSIFDKILAGFIIIQYFCEKDKTHSYFPIIENEVPVAVNFVDSLDGVFSPVANFNKEDM